MRVTVVAFCLLLAACGGKDTRTKVRVATYGTSIQMCCSPFYVAQRSGCFSDEGLDISRDNFPSGAKALWALIGGNADVAMINYAHLVQIAAKGQRIHSFFVLGRRATNVLVAAPKAARRITQVEDLKGATIRGVTGNLGGQPLGSITPDDEKWRCRIDPL